MRSRRSVAWATTAATALMVFSAALALSRANTCTEVDDWSTPAKPVRLLRLKQRPSPGRSYPALRDYMRVLERFPSLAERSWRGSRRGASACSFFGDPDHAEMGMRSMGNVVFVLSLLATDGAYDAAVSGVSRARVLEMARAGLEYMTRSHVTGDTVCGDGKPWGDHWQSAWWAAKMAVGAHLIWDRLTELERTRVLRVVEHEASRHLVRRAPGGATSNTRSEENAWDTEVLAAACGMMPDHPNAARWRAKLTEFALNSLSAPQDATSDTIVDGRPLREQVYTANVHSDFMIENHGAYHTCYMACPLHSLTWGYYALAARGAVVPDAQFHHFADVWQRLKPTYMMRRFAYPAGKDWPRYAYGMAFVMPALVLAQYRFGDAAARGIEALRFATLEEEQADNADGTFFGRRFTGNVMIGRMFEYETDCYANLGLGYLLHRRLGPPSRTPSVRDTEAAICGGYAGTEAGVSYLRAPGLLATMSWRSLDGPFPCAYFVPTDADDLAEWGTANLLGRIAVAGVDPKRTRVAHQELASSDRLTCSGSLRYYDRAGEPLYTHSVSFEADAPTRTATVRSVFRADAPITVSSAEGLRLHIANDRFNGFSRTWTSTAGRTRVVFEPVPGNQPREMVSERRLAGRWANVDDRIGVVDLLPGSEGFVLRTSNRRNGPWGSTNYMVLICPLRSGPVRYATGDTVLETHFRVLLGDVRRTRRLPASERTSQGIAGRAFERSGSQ